MSELVDPVLIEELVGARRNVFVHIGRMRIDGFYILHSQECVGSGIDLRDCRFSLALDSGIDPMDWPDRPVFLLFNEDGYLAPDLLNEVASEL